MSQISKPGHAATSLVEPQERGLERSWVGVGRRTRELAERTVEPEPAMTDDDNLVGSSRHFTEQMARYDNSAVFSRERTKKAAQPDDALGVEPVRRFVSDEDLRVGEECRRQPEPLAHAE